MRRGGLCASLCWVLLAYASAEASGDATPVPVPAHEVKAGYLLHFAKFVEWPAQVFVSRGAIEICVLGDDPLQRALDAASRGETVDSRPVVASTLDAAQPLDRCHIVFVGGAFHGDMEEMVPVAQRQHVLLVGEGEAFLGRGGMIAFVREAGRIRFDVDLRAASRAGLKLRSQLVQVARHVVRDDGD